MHPSRRMTLKNNMKFYAVFSPRFIHVRFEFSKKLFPLHIFLSKFWKFGYKVDLISILILLRLLMTYTAPYPSFKTRKVLKYALSP